jgi:hypothetical protein
MIYCTWIVGKPFGEMPCDIYGLVGIYLYNAGCNGIFWDINDHNVSLRPHTMVYIWRILPALFQVCLFFEMYPDE